jgi:hypothetical protein
MKTLPDIPSMKEGFDQAFIYLAVELLRTAPEAERKHLMRRIVNAAHNVGDSDAVLARIKEVNSWRERMPIKPCDHTWKNDEYNIEVCSKCGEERGELR